MEEQKITDEEGEELVRLALMIFKDINQDYMNEPKAIQMIIYKGLRVAYTTGKERGINESN